MDRIPESGKVYYIKNGIIEKRNTILKNWKKVLFLKEEKSSESKGWILDTMNCIDMIKKEEFSLNDMYMFEDILKEKYPNNNFIKEKLRQQLQLLRDKNYLEFLGRGRYKIIK